MATTVERQRGATPTQAEDSIQVENPATSQTIATLKAHTPEQLAEMVARARKAQPAWQALALWLARRHFSGAQAASAASATG